MARLQVFVPAYERPEWTAASVDSILAQSFSDLEVIVSDDSRSDRVDTALKKFSADPRFRYVRHTPRMGMSGNWNDCIKSATAEFVALFHDDDIYDREIVAKSIVLFDERPEVTFVHSSGRYVDEEGRDIGGVPHHWPRVTPGDEFIATLVRSKTSLVVCPTVIVRRSAYAIAGLFQETQGPGNDKEMWIRLARVGAVGFLDDPLILNRSRTGARAKAQLDWSVDTVRNSLHLSRMLPLIYGDSFVGRMRGELEYAFVRNLWPLESVGFLIQHERFADAARSCDMLGEFMSPPVKLLCEALADERNRRAAKRFVSVIVGARRAIRAARAITR